ncbi:MAG: DUF6320 domain-containing protein [Clostridia bacterium]
MRCKYCNIEIEGRAKVCPLCHEKLERPTVEEKPIAPAVDENDNIVDEKSNSIVNASDKFVAVEEKSFYPPRENQAKVKKPLTFNTIFFLVSIPLFLICLTINVLTTPHLLWFYLVGACEVYIYLLVRNTIHSANSIAVKILWQGIMLFFMVWIAETVFVRFELPNTEKWVLEYALPAVIGISVIVMAIFTAVLGKKQPAMILDCIFLSIVGYIPIIFYACHLVEHSIFAIVIMLLSSITIACCVIYGRAVLVADIRKRFHV